MGNLSKKRSFCIYCSGGASRVIKFYSFNENLTKYKPSKIIYDGQRPEIIRQLQKLFKSDLLLFDETLLTKDERKKLNTSTSKFIHKTLKENKIDYLFCFGERILKEDLIQEYKNKLINFHPSILPSFPGLNSIDKAINHGVCFLGNTAHFINKGIDTGKIIIQTGMLAEDFINYEDVLELQFPMLKIILRDILDYAIPDDEIFSEINNRSKKYLINKFVRE